MTFAITVRWADGSSQREQFSHADMVSELHSLTRLLDTMPPGETVTVERVS